MHLLITRHDFRCLLQSYLNFLKLTYQLSVSNNKSQSSVMPGGTAQPVYAIFAIVSLGDTNCTLHTILHPSSRHAFASTKTALSEKFLQKKKLISRTFKSSHLSSIYHRTAPKSGPTLVTPTAAGCGNMWDTISRQNSVKPRTNFPPHATICRGCEFFFSHISSYPYPPPAPPIHLMLVCSGYCQIIKKQLIFFRNRDSFSPVVGISGILPATPN